MGVCSADSTIAGALQWQRNDLGTKRDQLDLCGTRYTQWLTKTPDATTFTASCSIERGGVQLVMLETSEPEPEPERGAADLDCQIGLRMRTRRRELGVSQDALAAGGACPHSGRPNRQLL